MIRQGSGVRSGGSRPSLTEAQEDYLKQILLLGEGRERVSTQMLADRLAVRPASVTEMVVRLRELGLVDHAPYRGVRLSEAGRRVALEMVRHHRLLETYLVERLGYRWDQVHDEAERLEHVISERFEARIAESVGHPTHDPHGEPIPAADLSMPEGAGWRALTAVADGRRGAVARVAAPDGDSLARLRQLGLGPGARIVLEGRTSDALRLRVGGQLVLLPLPLAAKVWIEEEPTA